MRVKKDKHGNKKSNKLSLINNIEYIYIYKVTKRNDRKREGRKPT